MPSTLCTVHCRRPAMAALFEAWLVGDDEEHLAAVGEAVLDEVERVEQVLSRFDRGAELHRVNRQAALAPVRLSHELYEVLADCLRRRDETDGFFDVTAAAGPALAISRPERVQLDPLKRTVLFADPSVQLDLGGYGKGYALDAAATILARFGVESFLLNGGTSSLLARGLMSGDEPWRIALGDPFDADRREIVKFPLIDAGLSTSAAWDAHHVAADIVDPTERRWVTADEAYCVIAPTATEAEVLSTALTAMGRSRAEAFLAHHCERTGAQLDVRCVQRKSGRSKVRRLSEIGS